MVRLNSSLEHIPSQKVVLLQSTGQWVSAVTADAVIADVVTADAVVPDALVPDAVITNNDLRTVVTENGCGGRI